MYIKIQVYFLKQKYYIISENINIYCRLLFVFFWLKKFILCRGEFLLLFSCNNRHFWFNSLLVFLPSMSFLVSSVLKPVSDLKFSHFQAPRQQRALVACKVLLAGKDLVEILELTLSKMAAISSFSRFYSFFDALFQLRSLTRVLIASFI